MIKGYWNGEPNATFKVVIYSPGKAAVKTWWQNRVVGTMRQGLVITYGGETWLIDNECGDGYYKLTVGKGSPGCGHRSVDDYVIVEDVEDQNVNRYDHAKVLEEERLHDEWLMEYHLEDYNRIKSLRAALRSHQQQYK